MGDSQLDDAQALPVSEGPLALWFRRHQERLWWLHSLYALMFGVGMMWLGGRNFTYLRIAVFHISFIWLSSLLLPKLLNRRTLSPHWAPRLQLVVNFLNKNLYQQMLFFVLPIYYASATLGSRNIVFVVLVGLSALLSTIDIVYDRHLAVKHYLTAAFFAFNLFALINVMLPILWSVSNTLTTRISGVLAFIGFLTLGYPAAPTAFRRITLALGAALICFIATEFGRPFIPPAPLRIATTEFGTAFEPESLQMLAPVTGLTPGNSIQLYAMTSIKAPLGLLEKIRHHWYENRKSLCASSFYDVIGGRAEGFRLWTSCTISAVAPDTNVRLDLETEGDQLIGRAMLRARP
jgi:Family of unknown function (DUF5924)